MKKIFWRVFVAFGVVLLVFTILIGLMFTRFNRTNIVGAYKQQLGDLADGVVTRTSQAVKDHEADEFMDYLRAMEDFGKMQNVDIWIVADESSKHKLSDAYTNVQMDGLDIPKETENIIKTAFRGKKKSYSDYDEVYQTVMLHVAVPYNYYICYVTLENFNLSHVPVYMMSEEQLSMYALYMSTLGNRPDLFPSSGYIGKYITNRPPEHEVPESYLDDETFAAILKEAEKYLGFPYVWGGSSPSTSFDCSGFVSYVLTNSGLVNTGRLGAQGLYNVCTPVSNSSYVQNFVGSFSTYGAIRLYASSMSPSISADCKNSS